MEKYQVLKSGIELIRMADAAYLTTIDTEGFPSTRAMLNLRNSKQYPVLAEFMAKYDHDMTLFFTTNTSSNKVKQIMQNPKVSVYYCNPLTWHGFMCRGEMQIVKDKSIKYALWLDEWKLYYPEGKDSEDYTILQLKPDLVRNYAQLNQTNLKL